MCTIFFSLIAISVLMITKQAVFNKLIDFKRCLTRSKKTLLVFKNKYFTLQCQ